MIFDCSKSLAHRSYNIASGDVLSPNLDILMEDSVGTGANLLANSSDIRAQQRSKHDDSGDSDDYADSDN